MRKSTPTLEWHISESDAEWERLQALLPPEVTPALLLQSHRKRTLCSVATIFLLLAGIGIVWQVETNARSQAAESELRAVVQHKTQVNTTLANIVLPATIMTGRTIADWKQHDSGWASLGFTTSLQSVDQNASLDVTLQKVDFLDDQKLEDRAIVSVVMNNQSGKPVYRQTRFYQRSANGWLPIAPDATLWGAERSFETPYFVYHFAEKDEATVHAVAPQMDAIYITLWQNFGLPIASTSEKLVIDVRVTQAPGQASVFDAAHHISVASPARYLAPVDLTDAELLAQSIALPLLAYVLAHTRTSHSMIPSWQPLLDGLNLWQVWEMELPLAAWRHDLVQWLYVDLPTTQTGQPIVLPTRYAALCRVYPLWMQSPMHLNIPLWCSNLDRAAWHSTFGIAGAPPLRLAQLGIPVPAEMYIDATGEPLQFYNPGQTVALATFIDYAVATYGRDRLPALVAGLGQYDRWETLLPAVYGLSASEFEAGWQAYLTTHYGVSVALASGVK